MQEVYRNALRQMVAAAKAADMDIAIGWAVLLALLDDNDRLRRERDDLLTACQAAADWLDYYVADPELLPQLRAAIAKARKQVG